MYKNRTMFRRVKPVFIKGSGLIPYRRVVRGEGINDVFQSIVKGIGRVLSNQKLRDSAKRIAVSTGKKIFTKALEDKVVNTTSDVINRKINKIIDGVNEGPSTEITPQETLRAKNRIAQTIATKGEPAVENSLQEYLAKIRKKNKELSGSGMKKKKGRPRKNK
jgi:hypothetical protein